MRSEWLPTEADDEMAARIRNEYQCIAAHLGDAAPDPDEPVTVSITVDNAIHFTTQGAMFALSPSGVAVVYRPLPGGAEDASYWRDGTKVKHIVIPPPNESN